MIDADARERLVEEFRACLEDADDEAADAGAPLDLRSLLAEMAALKNEVRLQARQFKTALEQTQALADALRGHNERLLHDLERARADAVETKARAEHGLLLGLLELRDRLQAGLDAQAAWRPSPIQKLLGGEPRFARSLQEGSELTLRRLDELLASYRVHPIVALGQALDPRCMHAVAVESQPQAADGVVLRELRRGFFRGAELLRASEVVVNKKSGPA